MSIEGDLSRIAAALEIIAGHIVSPATVPTNLRALDVDAPAPQVKKTRKQPVQEEPAQEPAQEPVEEPAKATKAKTSGAVKFVDLRREFYEVLNKLRENRALGPLKARAIGMGLLEKHCGEGIKVLDEKTLAPEKYQSFYDDLQGVRREYTI